MQILAFILFFGLINSGESLERKPRENMLQGMPGDAAFWSRYHQNFQRVFDSARPRLRVRRRAPVLPYLHLLRWRLHNTIPKGLLRLSDIV